jgi:hypothetical protein
MYSDALKNKILKSLCELQCYYLRSKTVQLYLQVSHASTK